MTTRLRAQCVQMTAQPMDIAEPVASFKRKEASSPMTTQGASKEAKTAPMGGYKLTDKIVRLLLSEKSEAFAIGGPAATTRESDTAVHSDH